VLSLELAPPENQGLIKVLLTLSTTEDGFGRVDPDHVTYGFQKGAAVVLVSGCHFGDCHYIDANHHTAKRIERLDANWSARESAPSACTWNG
jgi:hypothetical protein